MWHCIFSISFTESKSSYWKTIIHLITASNNSQNMFIIYVIDLSTKNKMWRRGFIFFIKIKNTDGWKKKKKIFLVISFQKFLIFSYICFFRKSLMFRRRMPLKMLLYTRTEFRKFILGGCSSRRSLICLIVLLEVFCVVFAKLQWFCCE